MDGRDWMYFCACKHRIVSVTIGRGDRRPSAVGAGAHVFGADLLQQLGRRRPHHLHDPLQLVDVLTGGGGVKDRSSAPVERSHPVGVQIPLNQTLLSTPMTSSLRAEEGYSPFRGKALFLSAALP